MRLALAGDTMLGRKVGEAIDSSAPLFSEEVVAAVREADLVVLNLECCISERGERWPDPRKPFFFRAPPKAVEVLDHLGVDCVTLANNHALDYGPVALRDTLDLLSRAGIATVGAGRDVDEARAPAVVERDGFRLGVIGFTDHPEDFAAGASRPGVALVDLGVTELPGWLAEAIRGLDADAVLLTPHWGPNMTPEPLPHIRGMADLLLEAGATLVAGHSAHVFQGVRGPVLFDLGDFIDDYAVNPVLRNDLGLLFLVDLEDGRPARIEAIPLRLDYCHTRLATGADRDWIRGRFTAACAAFGTAVDDEAGRLVITP
ncbi:MAG: CapA family protein [Acidimicrobiia bacterium]